MNLAYDIVRIHVRRIQVLWLWFKEQCIQKRESDGLFTSKNVCYVYALCCALHGSICYFVRRSFELVMFADEKVVVGHGYQMPKRQSEELETRWRIRKEPVMLVESLVRSWEKCHKFNTTYQHAFRGIIWSGNQPYSFKIEFGPKSHRLTVFYPRSWSRLQERFFLHSIPICKVHLLC